MAVPNTWGYAVPHFVSDDPDRSRTPPRAADATQRLRVITCFRRGLFADAMRNVMEQEHFDVVTAHDSESIGELVSTAHGCIIDMSVDGASDALLAVSRRCSDLRVVILADATTNHGARAAARAMPRAHVTTGDSLDRVLAILRGEEVRFERRKRSERLHANGAGADRDPRRLTARELEILEGLLEGENTKVLAARLGVSQATARTHVQSVLSKLGVHSRLEAVALVNGGMQERIAGSRFNGAARC